ncbi:hypothetical protein NG2371_07112 [Nocardia gamkensis]|nr:hypothetical protein [Nocardia gamkensis]
MVVAAGGDGVGVAVAQELLVGWAVSVVGVVEQVVHERGGDGLVAVGVVLFSEVDEAVVWVEVSEAQVESARAAARGFDV